jgi:hypothetical protein
VERELETDTDDQEPAVTAILVAEIVPGNPEIR